MVTSFCRRWTSGESKTEPSIWAAGEDKPPSRPGASIWEVAPADKRLVIMDYNPAWPSRFVEIAEALRKRLDNSLVLGVDHIGSTADPGLPAKDLIDVQITVPTLDAVEEWPDELPGGLVRRPGITADHVPPDQTLQLTPLSGPSGTGQVDSTFTCTFANKDD